MKLLWIALAWTAYGALHSALASLRVKDLAARRWPRFMPAYRLAFNVVSAVALVPVLWLVYGAEGDWLWRWTGPAAWVANGLALAAVAGVVATARWYDMDEFMGLRQLREGERTGKDREGFVLSPFHRFVRHPWYFFGLVLVWTRDMDAPLLVSAVAITLYFAVGSRLEEKKLIARYGNDYRRHMEKVPGLIPLPWKHL